MGDSRAVNTHAITERLDALGWPDVLDLRKIRYTLNTANVRTQRVPKVLARLGYERLANPAAQDGVFYRSTSHTTGMRLTLYRRVGQ